MIPVYGTDQKTLDFFKTIPSGPESAPGIFVEDKKKDSDRPSRMQKYAEAVDKSLKYKEQKEVDAETGVSTDKKKDLDAVTPKGFKVGTDSTVVSGYTDPGFTLRGVKGRSFGGLIGTLGGAAIGLANPAIGAQLGASIGGKAGSYFD